MVAGSTEEDAGNKSTITMNVTQLTAMAPMGRYQRPRENGPLTRRRRPDVIRRKIGVA
jgi:hypothetical protein